MLDTFDQQRLRQASSDDLSDALERGSIVYFPRSPIELPDEADLEFLRQELPRLLRLKNVSYHHEAGRVRGLDSDDPAIVDRVSRILVSFSNAVSAFLESAAPRLTQDWTVGTTSFRPIEEQGRNLSAHASNELVHIDAGAYGATNGDRILRFFVNVNPDKDRVWVSKGNFSDLLAAHGERANLAFRGAGAGYLSKGPLDYLWSGLLSGFARAGMPSARVLDSSPFDREMRRFHNYMKDTPAFQQSPDGHEEFRFPPYSAWMVFTDTVSHACIGGQFAFVQTCIVRLANCRLPELAPINVLRQAAISGAAKEA